MNRRYEMAFLSSASLSWDENSYFVQADIYKLLYVLERAATTFFYNHKFALSSRYTSQIEIRVTKF